ncbi:uncharacterized protein LOC108861445 [Raphanus sativus]|uniref:Uncharacterized protein LOC108861445 n=1 Tax=Raphanus sativus TaxID=3726 RepID=A0A6J0P4C3_RAPSA|nr:uncharacterized protein LOC108861445 [Raphanus sativus]
MVLASEEEEKEEEDGCQKTSRQRDTEEEEAAPPYPASLAISKATSRSKRRLRKGWNRGK